MSIIQSILDIKSILDRRVNDFMKAFCEPHKLLPRLAQVHNLQEMKVALQDNHFIFLLLVNLRMNRGVESEVIKKIQMVYRKNR